MDSVAGSSCYLTLFKLKKAGCLILVHRTWAATVACRRAILFGTLRQAERGAVVGSSGVETTSVWLSSGCGGRRGYEVGACGLETHAAWLRLGW